MLDNQIKLYALLVDQLQRYNTIIWQFPTALFAANVLAVDRLANQPLWLLFVALLNLSMIFGFKRIFDEAERPDRGHQVGGGQPPPRCPRLRAQVRIIMGQRTMGCLRRPLRA